MHTCMVLICSLLGDMCTFEVTAPVKGYTILVYFISDSVNQKKAYEMLKNKTKHGFKVGMGDILSFAIYR